MIKILSLFMKGKLTENNTPKPSEPPPISFSFKFYDCGDKNFCISRWEEDKIAGALKRLKEVNEKTYNDLVRDNRVLHFHPVDWKQTTKPNGFPFSQANNVDAFQFELIGLNHGKARVYGALSNNIFHIVWFDFNHLIWPSFKKHT